MPLSIVTRNNYKVLIEATTNAIVSDAFEFRLDKNYTIITSPLAVGEIITIEVYNIGTDTWQAFKLSGSSVTLSKDYEILLLSDIGLVCRFSKPITTNQVSLIIVGK